MAVTSHDLVAEYVGSLANAGTAQGTNAPYISTWDNLCGTYDGALSGFTPDASSGWAGAGSAGDPYRLVFAGTDDVVTPSLWGVSSDLIFTYEAWVNIGAVTATQVIVAEGSTAAGGAYTSLRLVTGASYVYASLALYDSLGGSSLRQSSGTTVASGIHHFVGTCDATNSAIYMDGSIIGTDAAHSMSAANFATIDSANLGARQKAGLSVYLTAGLCTARIYNAKLTGAEVSANYAAGVLAYASSGGAPATWSGIRVTRHI